MNDRTQNLLTGLQRLTKIIRNAAGIQPPLFISLVLLRMLIRILYFLAAVLPFKILMVLGSGYTIPVFLQPYFESKGTMAYCLCLTIGLALVGAKSFERLIDAIKQRKARTFLGAGYTQKAKRRGNLILLISKATDASSAIIMATLSIVTLVYFHYQTGIAVIVSSTLCIGVIVLSQGDLREYINSSPLKYLESCITGITFIAFLILVHTSLNAPVPPGFLTLVVCLILIRQYCQSAEQTIAVTLSLKDEEERMKRIFMGVS